MTIGNLAALLQRNLKRMLAYSSIAHIGYMLIGLAAASSFGLSSVLFLLVYAFTASGPSASSWSCPATSLAKTWTSTLAWRDGQRCSRRSSRCACCRWPGCRARLFQQDVPVLGGGGARALRDRHLGCHQLGDLAVLLHPRDPPHVPGRADLRSAGLDRPRPVHFASSGHTRRPDHRPVLRPVH